MSNSKVTFRAQVLYTDGYSQNAAIQSTVESAYQSQTHGTIDIPITTGAGPFTIPFGAVVGATAFVVKNNTGQTVSVSCNTGALVYDDVPDGKSVLFCTEGTPNAPITDITVTTGITQAADGHIAFDVWGDPT